MTGPPTGAFHTPVYTERPRHDTSLGMPTFTALSVATYASCSRRRRGGSGRRYRLGVPLDGTRRLAALVRHDSARLAGAIATAPTRSVNGSRCDRRPKTEDRCA